MTKIKIISFLAVILLTTTKSGFAQITSSELDSLVEISMRKLNVAGISVAIVKDGKIIHNKGYGVKSVETNEKVNEHTQFAIASNSKAFTTTALALLVEEGKINWLDKVVDHIPEFKMYNAYVTQNFNIQDLLTHRSGLGLGIGDLMIFPDGSDFTIDDILSSFQYFKPQSAFRTKFDYDNLLYLIAGELIARKSGMTWEKYIQTHIFNPLEMDNSYPSLSHIKDLSNLSSPHNSKNGQLNALPNYIEMINGAAGGIYSNVDDICNWMLVHLNKGKYGENNDKELFSVASHDEMWKIHTTLNTNKNPRYKSHFAGYGLGWMLSDIKGNMSVSHTGGLPGMLSKTVMIPDLDLGIVVLTNTEPGGGAAFTAISQSIVDSYLELEDVHWVTKYEKHLNKRLAHDDKITNAVWAKIKETNDSLTIDTNYIGVYEDNWFGKVEVYKKDNNLWFKSYRSPKLNGKMHFYKANTFAIKWDYRDMNADAFAMFRLDENGRAIGIKMKGISPNIDFSFDFQDLDLKRIDSNE